MILKNTIYQSFSFKECLLYASQTKGDLFTKQYQIHVPHDFHFDFMYV